MTGDDFLDRARRAGAIVTDGPVGPDFTKGWGHQITFRSRGMIAHYWTKEHDPQLEAEVVAEFGERGRGAAIVVSACGLRKLTTSHVPLMGPGNLPFCARCENRLMKQMNNEE
jgi:hypothetical protein